MASQAVKEVNGNAAASAQLRLEIAGVCQKELRATDVLGRLGGEEFAAILPHTSLADAVEAAEKLREAIKRIRVESENVIIKVTASIGLAAMESEVGDLDTLLARADKALYGAKDQGRDRCVSARTAVVAGSRRRVLKRGRIIFNNRLSAIDCTIRSLGDEGAEIDVWDPHDIPEKFTLIIAPENVEKSCLVVGRSEKRIEVQFT